ncbi:MAG: hypothetical protein H6Q25_567 [Bacteroidetes bacterium]|nr:hypothetical protein [Bacteroidota bacterium]
MKKIRILILFLILTTGLQAQTYKLNLEISDISKGSGTIVIAVFNNQQSFKNEKNPYLKQFIPIKQIGKLVIELLLPPGNYAIAVFQDLNKNSRLDFNFLGIPTEPYGFSNNPSPLSIPEFRVVKIQIKGDQKILIRLNTLL